MKVNSTGLGQTTMVAAFTQLFKDPDGGQALKLKIESSEPIHWVITATLHPLLRHFIDAEEIEKEDISCQIRVTTQLSLVGGTTARSLPATYKMQVSRLWSSNVNTN
jgi:hypothetical protein